MYTTAMEYTVGEISWRFKCLDTGTPPPPASRASSRINICRDSFARRTRGGRRARKGAGRAGGEKGRLARIALQARLTGYRKADGNSIPTCTLGKIIPGTLPPEDDATFRVSPSLSLSLCISGDRLHKKASPSSRGPAPPVVWRASVTFAANDAHGAAGVSA